MDVAIIGASGSCGRQLAAQLLEQRVLPATARLQLVGHRGGKGEHELWGLRADLEDAFEDDAPTLDLAFEPSSISAELVVMLAGATVPPDPDARADRAALGRTNHAMFVHYARALAARGGQPPVVIVQSNPVELGVQVFADHLGRHRVLGAGAWSDTLRMRAEVAADLGIRRPQVRLPVFGQHGDHPVPAWSRLAVRGLDGPELAAYVARVRGGRSLAGMPDEIAAERQRMLQAVREGHIEAAYSRIEGLAPDLRAAVKPFFTHFTSGHTTEIVTAHAVADIIASVVSGAQRLIPAQVALDGEWLGIEGVVGAPVVLGGDLWQQVLPLVLADDEVEAVRGAADAVAAASAMVASDDVV